MDSIRHSSSYEDMKNNFEEKLNCAKKSVQLRGGWADDTVKELNLYKTELWKIAERVSSYKTAIKEGKMQIQIVKGLIKQMELSSENLNYMKNNLPKHLPCNDKLAQQDIHVNQTTNEIKENQPIPVKFEENNKSPKKKMVQEYPEVVPAKRPKPRPKVQYISIPDFDTVPKYVKGRIQFNQVNKAVDEINSAIDCKYNLLRRPRSKLSPIEMDLVATFKIQMNPESKGMVFVTDNDIKKFSSMKLDPTGRNILTIMRTLKRIKEIRGPKSLIRYCVVSPS